MEAWNRAMQGWQQFQSNVNQRADRAQTMRDAYLTEWNAEWQYKNRLKPLRAVNEPHADSLHPAKSGAPERASLFSASGGLRVFVRI